MNFYRYPSIEQFRNIVNYVRKNTTPGDSVPKITFTGHVKVHGMNAAIGYDGENIWAQSREQMLTEENNLSGFYQFVQSNKDYIKGILDSAAIRHKSIMVYGEWFGNGIQKGVGVSELPKSFVVFDVCGIGDDYDDLSYQFIEFFDNPSKNIFNKHMFGEHIVEIDFSNPELSVNEIVERTNSVEARCPVAWHFGVDGIGEGLVYSGFHNGTKLRFKSKGTKHSVSKVKTLSSVDIEVVENVSKFIDYAVTENRLNQGISYLRENNFDISVKNMSEFIKWVSNDIIKEESDVLTSNNLDYKKVGGKVALKAKEFFLKNCSAK